MVRILEARGWPMTADPKAFLMHVVETFYFSDGLYETRI